MNNSNKVAILVLCNSERVHDLNQLIKWLVITNFFGDLILLDRGPKYMNLSDLSFDLDLWGQRIKMGQTKEADTFSRKVLTGLSYTDKPYIAHLADDDFMMGDVLSKSADLLDLNPDITVSGGYTYWVKTEPGADKVIFKPYQTRDFTGDSVYERMRDLVLNYNHLIYCLMRRDAFASKHQALLDYSDICFEQYANSIISVITGKAKFINEIGHVRCTLPGSSKILYQNKSRDAFPHILLSDQFYDRLKEFKFRISNYLELHAVSIPDEYIDEMILSLIAWAFMGIRKDHGEFELNMSKSLGDQEKQKNRLSELGAMYQQRVNFKKFLI